MAGPPQRFRSATTRLLTLGLLIVQALSAGGPALAHATERDGGPVAVESRHSAQCAVLHDGSRCASCHFAQMRAAAGPAWRPLPDPAVAPIPTPVAPRSSHPASSRPAAPSRGPPLLS